MTETKPPKLFVSYSWTSPEHADWVLNLATQLVDVGVDVILDKWQLREGHDAIQFMETMVTDPDVKKVILVCDRTYADKTDKRHGGVGTEAQIISPQLYEKSAQDKFVAVIAEKDADGKPYRPAYYQSRIYIDLADPDAYTANFEKLVRWIYDKPLHVRPELGKKPAFLEGVAGISLGTTLQFSRAIDALRNDRGNALVIANEFFDTVVENIDRFVITEATQETLDRLILERVEQFIPYRNECIDVLRHLVQLRDTLETRTIVHRFFERLIPFMNRPSGKPGSFFSDQYDNMKFVVHELFLYALALLIRQERFEFAAYMMDERYFVPGSGGDKMRSFTEFRDYAESFARMGKLKRRVSLRADLLEQRSHSSNVPFSQLMQADLVLHTRGLVSDTDYWWPESLLYSTFDERGPREIFARAASQRYFNRIAPMLGVSSKQDLERIEASLQADPSRRARWDYHPLAWSTLVNLEKLATQP